ncbi:type I restriction endonuclease subunit R [Patescibacteria group bacterium]
MKFNEKYTVENYIIEYLSGVNPSGFGGGGVKSQRNTSLSLLKEGTMRKSPADSHLGYEYIPPKEFAKLREFENEYIITSHLAEAIKRINDIDDDVIIQTVIREIKKLDTNEGFLNAVRNGVDLIDVATKKTINYQIVDWAELGAPTPSVSPPLAGGEHNRFVITNQFYFEGNSENIRPDILIFLNGLPIVDIEAKSPTAGNGINYENGIDQIKRYEKNARRLFLPNCFNISTDGLKTFYGATYSEKQYFFEWKEEKPYPNEEKALEITLDALLDKTNLLDIIKNFILFEKNTDSENCLIKKICRYQQMRASNKIVARVKNGETKRGLIWHTQGSGKSLTMFFTAWKLRFMKKLKNPKVFILVDRQDLDEQITDTFLSCGGKNIIKITSKRDLAKKIVNDERGIFISTIQKFNDLPKGIENKNENLIILCDEGHRSNEGFASINLRASMKNAFFFGFTGTPIDKKTLNTHHNFGEQGERYLDYYSIQQAIDDGATLPVTYEARLSKFFIDEKQLDKQFDELTKNLEENQKEELTKKYGKKEAIVKLEKRMRAVIQDIVEHYKLYVLPNGFKAQIVCLNREATARYKEMLDEFVPKEWSAVIYSPGDPNSDSDDLKKYNTNKAKRDKIIAKFKNPKSSLKFLLVCDMLLTGFDAPIEQVMYLDKPLRDHNLLQAIARTNRLYKNKGCGKIIDYYGITKNLYNALNFDETVVESAMINFDRIKDEFTKILDEIMDIFVGGNIEDPSINNLRRCLKIFIDNEDKQQYFSDKYARLKLLFEILSPDPFLKEHLRKFEWVTSFYLAFVKEFKSEENDLNLFDEYGEKVKNLIQEKIDYEGITKNFRELRVNDLYVMEKLNKMEDEEKALNLEKMLKQEISINIDTNPAFKKFSERLVAIKKQFEQNQIDLSERIKKYYELLNNVKNKNDEAKKLDYNLKEYGLYNISKEFLNDKDGGSIVRDKKSIHEFIKKMAKKVDDILDEGWQESSKRDEFLKNIKKTIQELILKDYAYSIKVNNFHKYLNRLVDIVIKKF